MARYTKTNVVIGDVVKSDINVQLGLIETALTDTLSRKGDLPNTMEADIDLNSNDILNVNSLDTATLTIAGVEVQNVVTASLVNRVTVNETDIATNVTNIATNVSNISSNDTDIATNVTDIATNVTDITTNATNIATNATNIATNVTDIAVLQAGTTAAEVRHSKLDNPLVHLFKKNKLSETLSGSLTTTRSTIATFLDRYGIIRTASVDVLREESNGWLIEDESTNTGLHSEEFDNAVHVKTQCTISPDAIIAPDGNVTMDKFIPDVSAGAGSRLTQTGIVTSTGTWTISMRYKAAEFTTAHMEFFSTEDGSGIAEWDLSTGVLLSSSAALDSTSIKLLGDGSYECSITKTFTGITSNQCNPLRIATGDVSSADGSKGYYGWGLQVEKQSVVTSYIKTTTAAVTRTADLVTSKSVNNLPDAGQDFSFLVKAKFDNDTGKSSQWLLNADMAASGSNFRLGIAVNTNGSVSFFAFSSTAVTGGSFTFNSVNDIVCTYTASTSTAALYVNGAFISETVITQTDAIDFVTDSMSYGKRHNSTSVSITSGNLLDFRITDFPLNADEVSLWSD